MRPAGTAQETAATSRMRICPYDRAGLAWSEPGPSPRTANADPARRSTRGQLVIAERSHRYIQLDGPDLVIDPSNQVVDSVRAEGVQQ
jgi:hypothetical protein